MRSAIENWLLSYWYGAKHPPLVLRALESLYQSVFNFRKTRAGTHSIQYRPCKPLIVVGNITAGGTGKTPLVTRLCEIAAELDMKVGIASTGYGRESRKTEHVFEDSDPRVCGDEPVLLAQRTHVPVVVATNRTDAIRTLDAMDIDVIISDDGLQQPDLTGDIEICVVDGARGVGNGFQIPAGPLREPIDRLGQVDYVVSNGSWTDRPPGLTVYPMELRAATVCSLGTESNQSLDTFKDRFAGTEVHAIAGIGNPKRFFSMLKSLGISVETHAFSDHHSFTDKDIDPFRNAAAIIMTEKDAVKCRSLGLHNAWYLPVNCQLTTELETRLKEHMKNLTIDRV